MKIETTASIRLTEPYSTIKMIMMQPDSNLSTLLLGSSIGGSMPYSFLSSAVEILNYVCSGS